MNDLHPLWRYLPPERQNRQELLRLRSRRLVARLQVVVNGGPRDHDHVLIWLSLLVVTLIQSCPAATAAGATGGWMVSADVAQFNG